MTTEPRCPRCGHELVLCKNPVALDDSYHCWSCFNEVYSVYDLSVIGHIDDGVEMTKSALVEGKE